MGKGKCYGLNQFKFGLDKQYDCWDLWLLTNQSVYIRLAQLPSDPFIVITPHQNLSTRNSKSINYCVWQQLRQISTKKNKKATISKNLEDVKQAIYRSLVIGSPRL